MPATVTVKVRQGGTGVIYDATSDTPGTIVIIDDGIHLATSPNFQPGATLSNPTDAHGRPSKRAQVTT